MFGIKNNAVEVVNGPLPRTVTVTRLTREVYDNFEKSLNGNGFVTATTTDLQAGFMLGINHALRMLREGITIETA